MILKSRAVSLAEVKELVEDLEEKKDLKDYLKRYGKLSKVKSDELCAEIKKLDNLKLKEGHIIKIADFLPKNVADLQKIFNDVSLDEKEANEILKIARNY